MNHVTLQKLSLSALAIAFVSFIGFSQTPEYVGIPQLSEKIKVEGDGIAVQKVSFNYKPTYTYTDGIVFGTEVMVFVFGIADVNNFEGASFVLKKEKFSSADGQTVILDQDWSWASEGNSIRLKEEDQLYCNFPIRVGNPMFSGDYIWEVWLADVRTGKKTKITVPLTVVSNPLLALSSKGKVSATEIYLYNAKYDMIYTGQAMPAGELSFIFKTIVGFKKIDDNYRVGMELEMSTADGVSLGHADDIMQGHEMQPEINGALQLWADFKLVPELAGQTIILKARIWDKNGSGCETSVQTTVKII